MRPIDDGLTNWQRWYNRHREQENARSRSKLQRLRLNQSFRDHQNKLRNERRRAMRAYITKIKQRPCHDCRRRFEPEVMDFDHVRGQKLEEVGRIVSNCRSMTRLVE